MRIASRISTISSHDAMSVSSVCCTAQSVPDAATSQLLAVTWPSAPSATLVVYGHVQMAE